MNSCTLYKEIKRQIAGLIPNFYTHTMLDIISIESYFSFLTPIIVTILIKKIPLYGDQCLTGTCCFWNYSPIGKNVCVIFYIDFVRGNPFQKAKIIQKLSVTVYYQKRLSDLDTLIKITITKIIYHIKVFFYS
jgi:hypothetical protein